MAEEIARAKPEANITDMGLFHVSSLETRQGGDGQIVRQLLSSLYFTGHYILPFFFSLFPVVDQPFKYWFAVVYGTLIPHIIEKNTLKTF